MTPEVQNFPPHGQELRRSDSLTNQAMRTLGREYLLVGEQRVKSWQAWLIIGVTVGIIVGILIVANRSGEISPSGAQRRIPIEVRSPDSGES